MSPQKECRFLFIFRVFFPEDDCITYACPPVASSFLLLLHIRVIILTFF